MPDNYNKTIQIIVNSREKEWGEKHISYEDVVILAFGSYSSANNILYSVTYESKNGNKEGSLVGGENIIVKEGMVFNVTPTNKS